MSSLLYDVVVLPDEEMSNIAIKASEDLCEYGNLFTLEDRKIYPHDSLDMLRIKEFDLGKVQSTLSTIAKNTSLFELVASRINQSMDYIDVEYDKTEKIIELQRIVVTKLNLVSDGMRKNDKPV